MPRVAQVENAVISIDKNTLSALNGVDLANYFDELLNLSNCKNVSSENLSNYLVNLCKMVQEKDTAKYFLVVDHLTNIISVKISLQAFNDLMNFFIMQLNKKPRSNDFIIAGLRGMGAILYACGCRCDKFRLQLLHPHNGILAQFTKSCNEVIERLAFQCISNLCIKCEKNYIASNLQESAFKLLLEGVKKNSNHGEIPTCRLFVTCFTGIASIISYGNQFHHSSFGLILSILRSVMCISVPGCTSFPDLAKISPLLPSRVISTSNAGHLFESPDVLSMDIEGKPFDIRPNRRVLQVRHKDSEHGEISEQFSEDDVREIETSNEHLKNFQQDANMEPFDSSEIQFTVDPNKHSLLADTESTKKGVYRKVRLVTLTCFSELLKWAPPKLLFNYWWHFIPDAKLNNFEPIQYPLFYILLRDYFVKTRQMALECLHFLITSSRDYFYAADDRSRSFDTPSFIPYSHKLATSIKELHRFLINITSLDTGYATLPYALKCLSQLILGTPYAQLQLGILTTTLRHILNFTNCAHFPTRTAAFACLTSICRVEPALAEVYQLFSTNQRPSALLSGAVSPFSGAQTPIHLSQLWKPNSEFDSPLMQNDSGNLEIALPPDLQGGSPAELCGRGASSMPWILQLCKSVIFYSQKQVSDSMSLRVEAFSILSFLCRQYFELLRVHIGTLTNCAQHGIEEHEPSDIKVSALHLLEEIGRALARLEPNSDDSTDVFWFWSKLLGGAPGIVYLLQNSSCGKVRATCCDCLTALCSSVYEQLPQRQKMLCVTLVIGFCSDEDPVVCGAAVRALGTYIQFFPSLKSDYVFINDVYESVCNLIQHSNRVVRGNACWTLGNLADNFMTLSNSDTDMIHEISPEVLTSCLSAATIAAKDRQKTKYNAVRAIGSILNCLPLSMIEDVKFKIVIQESADALISLIIKSISKVRWNACYAARLVLLNDHLRSHFSKTIILPIIRQLTNTLQSCSNFKVKIHCCEALLSAKSADFSYNDGCKLWKTLNGTLSETENFSHFKDFKHQSFLQTILCQCIYFYINLLPVDVLISGFTIFKEHESILTQLLSSYRQHPEEGSLEFQLLNDESQILKFISKFSEEDGDVFNRIFFSSSEKPLKTSANFKADYS